MACADSFGASNKIWHALIVLLGDKSNKIWHALIVLHGTRATRYGMR